MFEVRVLALLWFDNNRSKVGRMTMTIHEQGGSRTTSPALRRHLSGWMLCAAMSLTACDGVAPYDGTIWDNPLPDSAYPGPVPIHGTYHSSAMNVNVGYNVVLPPEYASHPEARFPVVYVLHGAGGDENAYLLANGGLNPPALGYINFDQSGIIVVYPNGGRQSKYYDAAPGSPMYGHEMVETTILYELIPHIDDNFRTIPSREGRAIMGGSMGGLGALRLAFKRPDMFSSVRSWSAAVFPTAHHAFNAIRGVDVGRYMFNNDGNLYEEGNPYNLAKQNADWIKSLGVGIHMCIGGDDGFLPTNRALIGELDKLGIPHDALQIFPGLGHELGVVSLDSLQWAKQYFSYTWIN
jgi:S-formylglutathione hydrolase FrmB